MEAANEVPGPSVRCKESTDAALAGSDPTHRRKEHTRDVAAWHSPGIAGGDTRGSPQELSPGWQSSQPQGQDPRQP